MFRYNFSGLKWQSFPLHQPAIFPIKPSFCGAFSETFLKPSVKNECINKNLTEIPGTGAKKAVSKTTILQREVEGEGQMAMPTRGDGQALGPRTGCWENTEFQGIWGWPRPILTPEWPEPPGRNILSYPLATLILKHFKGRRWSSTQKLCRPAEGLEMSWQQHPQCDHELTAIP